MTNKKIPMRTVKSAPKEGKIPKELIRAAVKKVVQNRVVAEFDELVPDKNLKKH